MDLENQWLEKFNLSAQSCSSDHEAAHWTKYSMDKRMAACLDYIKNSSQPGASVLDIGCGTGMYLDQLQKLGYRAEGIDYSKKMVVRARSQYNLENVWQASIYDTKAKEEMFDILIAMGVFQYLTYPTRAINELYRITKPNGLVIINTLNKKFIAKSISEKKVKQHIIFSDPGQLKSAFKKAAFKSVQIIPFFLYPKSARFLDKFDSILSKFLSVYLAHDFFLFARK